MWGFLLPTLHAIIQNERLKPGSEYHVQTSGPVMDQVFQTIADASSFQINITKDEPNEGINHVIVKRWDHWLLYLSTQKNNVQSKVLWKYLDDHQEIESFLINSIKEIRDFLLPIVNNEVKQLDYRDHFIILKRSAPPAYYKDSGEAKNKTYGSARRSIIGLEETVSFLNEKKIPTKIFESGKHNILEQIKVFNDCKGVIGVRGAEFANLIWMNPKKKALMILPSNMYSYSIPKAFAEIMQLDFHIIKALGGKHPKLDSIELYNIIRNIAS